MSENTHGHAQVLWRTVLYNVANHPLSFTSADRQSRIDSDYDYQGRRYTKKVTRQGSLISHERYLYRGYLQIAALDMLNSQVLIRRILWDPKEPSATRPLALLQEGKLYSYGHDFLKNVTEIFDETNKIATTYDYSPYGAVTETSTTNNITQPYQWSSQIADPELTLIYYNYRHYNPTDGRWINRDPIQEQGGWNLYTLFYINLMTDRLGLFLFGLFGQQQPNAADYVAVQTPVLSYKTKLKKAGKCGHFRLDIEWKLEGVKGNKGIIYQEVKTTREFSDCQASDGQKLEISGHLRESWNIGGVMKDTWSLVRIGYVAKTKGSAMFTGEAYYVDHKLKISKPTSWTYKGDVDEPLCKGGVCLADAAHDNLQNTPPAQSNKVERTVKISWCCCDGEKDTKFEN